MDCRLPGSSVHGILQARRPEWVAIPSAGYLLNSGIKPESPALHADSFPLSHLGSPYPTKQTETSEWLTAGWYLGPEPAEQTDVPSGAENVPASATQGALTHLGHSPWEPQGKGSHVCPPGWPCTEVLSPFLLPLPYQHENCWIPIPLWASQVALETWVKTCWRHKKHGLNLWVREISWRGA